jgi:hypothetical protein
VDQSEGAGAHFSAGSLGLAGCMARWIRDPRLRAFQAEIRNEIRRAAALAEGSPYVVYIILDPSRSDPLGRHPEGSPLYVGQSKDLRDRADSHMRDGGGGTGDSSIKAGRLKELMDRFEVPVFRIVDTAPTHLTSLIAETVWARRYVWLGYELANQWPEHRSRERPRGLSSIPPKRLRRLTVAEALDDEVTIELNCRTCGMSGVIDLTRIEPFAKLGSMAGTKCERCGGLFVRLRKPDPATWRWASYEPSPMPRRFAPQDPPPQARCVAGRAP